MNDEGTIPPRATTPRPDAETYFTSDPHYYHENIVKLCDRPFRSVHHMNENLVRNHNFVVQPGDIVYFLGDVVMGRNFEDNLRIIDRLNGYKILVVGNHDRPSYAWSKSNETKQRRWYEVYRRHFDVVLSDNVAGWPITLGGIKMVMSHYPYTGDSHDQDRHAKLRPTDAGLPLIHGHVHERWRTRDRMFNVGVDVNNFTPVHSSVIIEWARGLSALQAG